MELQTSAYSIGQPMPDQVYIAMSKPLEKSISVYSSIQFFLAWSLKFNAEIKQMIYMRPFSHKYL